MMLYFKFILIFYVSLNKAESEDYCGISGPEDNIRKWWKREIGFWIFKKRFLVSISKSYLIFCLYLQTIKILKMKILLAF